MKLPEELSILQTISERLGSILAKVESMEKQQFRITLTLIGVIAAQIGVKILGTDPLLDIATALALIGITLLVGGVWLGIRMHNAGTHLTKSGWWLMAFMLIVGITQATLYCRDLGLMGARWVYMVRILQNLAMIGMAWSLIMETRITQKK